MNHYYDIETGLLLVLKPRSTSRIMRLVEKISPGAKNMWTTIGHTVYYPDWLKQSVDKHQADWNDSIRSTVKHELVHVKQYKKYGVIGFMLVYFALPLPVLFSGRWMLERDAYLVNILDGMRTVDECVDILWSKYGWCWPRSLMRRWFKEKLNDN